MMRFCSLGSGSTGNATLIEASSGTTTTRLLVDCGFSLRELGTRLQTCGVSVEDIDAVFVTHEHGDHVGCALKLARRHDIALWMSRGTWQAVDDGEPITDLHFARDGLALAIGDISVTPYTVPHDAREPLQLTCSDGALKLGVLTDVGSVTEHLVQHLQHCHALLLECNHDTQRLAASGYPASLKARIAGPRGHLANDLAAEVLRRCRHAKLLHVVAAHLSERNNSPLLAREALSTVLDCSTDDIDVADPLSGLDWRTLS